MAKVIKMPKMGNTVESVIVGDIKIKVGDEIKKDQVLFSYETDKSTTEYKAEQEGKVQAILMESGEEVQVLVPVIVLGEDGEDISEFIAKKETPQESTSKPDANDLNKSAELKENKSIKKDLSFGGKASPRAKATAKNLGVNISNVGGSGIEGRIVEGDILSFYHADGTLATGAPGNLQYKELLIQAIAKELGFDIATNVAQEEPIEKTATQLAEYPAGGGIMADATPIPNGAKRKTFNPVRSAIASTMMNSLMQSAQLSMGIDIDASSLLAARAKIKKLAADNKRANSSINDLIVFALSRILPKHPHLNAQVGFDFSDEFDVAHIAVAVDAPSGLFVPVVKDASKKSLDEITASTKELIKKAQDGAITPDDMANGTFTISNLGLSGISFFTPVLNPPQAALLGVGSPIKRLKMDDTGKVVEYPEITLSLTMDHRPNDGIAGTIFLKELKESLENIDSLLA